MKYEAKTGLWQWSSHCNKEHRSTRDFPRQNMRPKQGCGSGPHIEIPIPALEIYSGIFRNIPDIPEYSGPEYAPGPDGCLCIPEVVVADHLS